jgi:hypothetical protein
VSPASASLITPTGGITVVGARVGLFWEPVGPDGGSDVVYQVSVDDSLYSTAESVYTVTRLAEGSHTWGVQVKDAAGNRSTWVTDTFRARRFSVWLHPVMREFSRTSELSLVNGGFENDDGWVLNRLAIYDTTRFRSGARSARLGIVPGDPGVYSYSSVAQTFAIPSTTSASLRLWVFPLGEGGDSGDWHYISLYDQQGVYHSLRTWHSNSQVWEQLELDVGAFAGQTVTLYIGTRNDGDEDTAAMYVDDVKIMLGP